MHDVRPLPPPPRLRLVVPPPPPILLPSPPPVFSPLFLTTFHGWSCVSRKFLPCVYASFSVCAPRGSHGSPLHSMGPHSCFGDWLLILGIRVTLSELYCSHVWGQTYSELEWFAPHNGTAFLTALIKGFRGNCCATSTAILLFYL